MQLRTDWTLDEVREIHDQALPDLMFRAQQVHREAWGGHDVQLVTPCRQFLDEAGEDAAGRSGVRCEVRADDDEP